ncbi:uncharacterized protein [Equus przewalskii]|uniref:Uncharacterized protein n=1 Tax=Equus przewalskii TaxID=9798 RepID=A0ABM4M2G5_EQUPR|nr:uncharacterized protein LOC111770137 isoform X2 [Equus caballus]
MDPLPLTLTGHSPWNEADTPQTRDLKHLRAKRVAYYECIGIIKSDASRNGSQAVSKASQDNKVNPSESQTFGVRPQRSPRYSAVGKKPLREERSKVAPGEAEQCQDHRAQEGPKGNSCPTELDLHLLADALVPETQKLRHVINWAQKFLSNPPEERGLKRSTTSLGLPLSNLYQSSEALGSKRSAHLRSSDSLPLNREDQSSTQTDIPSCPSRPQKSWSETSLSSEFPGSFLKEGFLGSHSCGWQETTFRNEGEGRTTTSSPDSLQMEDSAQEKYERAGDIQTPNEDEMFPEGLGAQLQLRHTSEESKVLEETRQNPPRNGYFWTPLTDSSEEERLDEPGESRGTPGRSVLGRRCRGFSGIALSPTSDSTLVSKTMVLSAASFPQETPLEAEVREERRGAAQFPVGTPKDVTVEFRADSSRGEDPIQRLLEGQRMPRYDSSSERRKESDHVGFTLGPPQTYIKHKNEWKHIITERAGKTITGRVQRGGPNRSVQSSAESSAPVTTQRQFALTQPESYLAPQIASLLLNVSEGPLQNAAFHGRTGAGVFCGPTADAHGARGSTWFDEVPPSEMNDRSVQTPRMITRQTTHEQKEKTLPSSCPISGEISKTGLKGSFPLQDVGLSWSDEPPHEQEPGASVLETYYYYLHMFNKIKSLSSEERSSSLPSQEPRLSKSESVITSPRGKGKSKGASLDRETKEWRDGSESDAAVEGKLCSASPKMTSRMTSSEGYWEMSSPACSSRKHGDVKPRSQTILRPSSAEAEERTSAGTYSSAYAVGSVEKFLCKNVPQDVERENELLS